MFGKKFNPKHKWDEDTQKETLNKFRENSYSKKEEWQMIWIALKTFAPWIVLVCLIIFGIPFMIVNVLL